MSEDIQELFQIVFVWLWAIVLLFIVGMSILTITQYVNFQDAANQVISRYGGVTTKAVSTLDTMSNNFYAGKFDVESTDSATKNYGDMIDYSIQIKLPVLSKITTFTVDNSTVSNVRKETGD